MLLFVLFFAAVQVIIPMSCSPEKYVFWKWHLKVKAPSRCPVCRKRHSLKKHGFYWRFVSDSLGKALEIPVRRFKCAECGKTTSCLPSFAQPYHFVNNVTIGKYLIGDRSGKDVEATRACLKKYNRRVKKHAAALVGRAGEQYGKTPRAGIVDRILDACGNLSNATRRLVADYHTTCFGTYACHQAA